MIHKKRPILLLLVLTLNLTRVTAQSASFNFTASPHTLSGWTNVAGDPSLAVLTVTDPSGITVNSVATANWSQYGDQASYDGLGENVNGFFPGAVLVNHWYNYDNVYNAAQPQLAITGLSRGRLYSLKMSGSSTSTIGTNPSVYTVVGLINYGGLGVNSHNNSTDGAVFGGISPDSTGTIHIYVNNVLPMSQAADICGLVVTTLPVTGSQLSSGVGVAQLGNTLALGDSVTGPGPHSFSANRNQYLNGYQYSFGGSANDPVNHPVMRLYDNGNLAMGTTMNLSANPVGTPGLLFYPRVGMGLLQLGGSDVPDTLSSKTFGPGILMNAGKPNTIKGQMYTSILVGDSNTFDTAAQINWVILSGSGIYINADNDHSMDLGSGHRLIGITQDMLLSGTGNVIYGQTSTVNEISGSGNIGVDTARGSLIGGANNQYGGLWQFVSGVGLTNRSPGAAAVGSGNVDFATLPYTGLKGLTTPQLTRYPVYAIGNAGSTAVHSNAMTVLFNGRTQINTTGFGSSLTQDFVTPKAALDIVSANTGALFPRLSTAQRGGIVAGDLQNGLLLYNKDSSIFQYYTGSGWKALGAGSGGSAHWLSGGVSIYDSLENIAIGTGSTDGYKLAVNGNAVVTRLNVKPPASWPDFVFRPGYRLRSLAELGRYVGSRRHLPGIAGEQEVRRGGLDVAEQQAALLKKVEELTLYMIGLDKQASTLELANARLRKKLLRDKRK
jgi:hypothetical protein